jgi:hypothetical protein
VTAIMKKYFESKDGHIIRFDYVVGILNIPANTEWSEGFDDDQFTVGPSSEPTILIILLNGPPQWYLVKDCGNFIDEYKEWADNIDTEFEKYERLSVHAAEVASKLKQQ